MILHRIRLSPEGSLRADAWALQALKTYQNGKLILWSWISRGLTTLEQAAEWYHNGDLECAKDAMKAVRGGMADLYHLDKVPSIEPLDEIADDQNAHVPLEGELHQFWVIQDQDAPNADPIPLPSWFQLPIDNILLTWKKEHEVWEIRKNKRRANGYGSLAPKMQKAYDRWLDAPTRILVLDKARRAQVMNAGRKSEKTLKKTCLLLVIHPSLDPSDLWIQSGSGKKWALRLLEGRAIPDVGVPEVVDHFSGWFLRNIYLYYVVLWLQSICFFFMEIYRQLSNSEVVFKVMDYLFG